MEYRRRQRQAGARRNAEKEALRKVAEEAARRNAKETAALLEAEAVAPDLLTTLQHGLEESPDQRRFRVLQGTLPISFAPGATIDYSPTASGDGDLKGWVARHAADGLVVQGGL